MLSIKDYLFAGAMVAMIVFCGFQKWTILGLEADNARLNTQVIGYIATARAAKVEAEAKVITVTKEVEVIKWKTETKIKTIKEYVRDESQSDCSNALNFARSYF